MKCLAIKILLLVCLQHMAMAADTVKIKPVSAQQLNQWRIEARKALFIPSPAPAAKPHVFDSFSVMPGVRVQHVTYGTLYNMRVPAIVYAPQNPKGKVPAVIVVAGHGGDKATWYEIYAGLLYAKAGAVVITYDPIGENERSSLHQSNAREHDIALPGAQSPARMGGLMVGDVMQAVSYALGRPDVDPKRIAVLGYSMGSFHAALAAALDPRIHALVLSGGGDLDGNGGAWDLSTKVMCQGGPYRALSFLPDKAAILYALHQHSGTTLILNGSEDGLITKPHHLDTFFIDLRKRVSALTGPGAPLLDHRFYAGIAHRPSWLNTDAFSWLHAQFHFANGDALLAMGTTHIAEWAAATGAHINKGYEVEEREGGIRAVGAGFPALSPSQLQTVSTAQWQAHRDNYIWSSSAKKILQAQGLPATLLPQPNNVKH
ncbi:alpha/beta hydrolase [Mucilaginibacter sp. AW1-3]